MIKAAGTHLTNILNGSIYGFMKTWSFFEIRNFGEMLLYFSLQKCIIDRPSPLFRDDFMRKKKRSDIYEPKKYHVKSNFELNGILDSFLNM